MKRRILIFLILLFCGAAALSCGQAAVPDLPEEDLVRTEPDVEDEGDFVVAESDGDDDFKKRMPDLWFRNA